MQKNKAFLSNFHGFLLLYNNSISITLELSCEMQNMLFG